MMNHAYSFYVTQESNCTLIDLRNDFPLKMRNQGNISWCYAHAAADYLQFFSRVPVQISASDIALNYNHRKWPRLLNWLRGGLVPETGFIRGAMVDISSIGYCPEEYLPSETWTKRTMTGEGKGEAIQVPLGTAIQDILSLKQNALNGIYLTPADLPFVYEFKEVSHEQFYEIIFKSVNGFVLDELRSLACDSHRMPFPKTITGIEMNFRGKNAFNRINRVLDQKSPLTVDFFYGFLENIDQYKVSFSELHTTLLMGRRYNSSNQECQYLIKNSYGTDCSSYDPRHQCEGGYIWVSESSLYRAMTSYDYISSSEKLITGTAEQIQDDVDYQSNSSAH